MRTIRCEKQRPRRNVDTTLRDQRGARVATGQPEAFGFVTPTRSCAPSPSLGAKSARGTSGWRPLLERCQVVSLHDRYRAVRLAERSGGCLGAGRSAKLRNHRGPARVRSRSLHGQDISSLAERCDCDPNLLSTCVAAMIVCAVERERWLVREMALAVSSERNGYSDIARAEPREAIARLEQGTHVGTPDQDFRQPRRWREPLGGAGGG
jgi:hypothetical protein